MFVYLWIALRVSLSVARITIHVFEKEAYEVYPPPTPATREPPTRPLVLLRALKNVLVGNLWRNLG